MIRVWLGEGQLAGVYYVTNVAIITNRILVAKIPKIRTIFADIQFNKSSKVGNAWRYTIQVIFTCTQLPQCG